MSGIGGIFNLDGSPVDKEKIQRISDSLTKRGPDGLRIWESGPLALVHSHFWTTPEEVGEEQPITRGNLTLAADARIDNRGELIPLLAKHLSKEVPSDAEIILAAYQKWKEDAPRHLIGDFAFAIWDDEEERLFCARDPVGVRLFQYAQIGTSFVFGSSVGAVIAALEVIPEINIPFIADLLANRWERWVHETGYQEIFRLPPAYSLTVSSEGMAMQRYWTFGADQRYHFDTDEEYIACFRELFQEAVRCRMRAVGPVALSVSGGLDSSSIACVVNDLIEKKEIEPGARMYSRVFHYTPCADEREFFDLVAARCPHLPYTLVPSDEMWAHQDSEDETSFPLDDPDTDAFRSYFLKFQRQIGMGGCRVCISGNGGDFVLNTNAYYYFFLLPDLGPKRLFSELLKFPPFRKPHALNLPSRRILLMMRFFLPGIRRILLAQENRSTKKNMPPFLIQSSGDSPPPPDFLPPPDLNSRSALWIYDSVTDGYHSALQAGFDRKTAYSNSEWRHPYYDRRIIDFMLSLPPHLCYKEGYSRYILRRAMVGCLPERIRWRRSKAHLGQLQVQGLKEKEREKILPLLTDSRMVKLDLVDGACLSKTFHSYWEDDSSSDEWSNLVTFLDSYLFVEQWLRYNEKNKEEFQMDINL